MEGTALLIPQICGLTKQSRCAGYSITEIGQRVLKAHCGTVGNCKGRTSTVLLELYSKDTKDTQVLHCSATWINVYKNNNEMSGKTKY